MPEPLQPLRRLAQMRTLTRTASHLAVVALVTFASAFGIAQARNSDQPASGEQAGFFTLISPARGADGAPVEWRSLSFTTQPDPQGFAEEELLSRGTVARAPGLEPLPKPVPVDPDAEPLAAPAPATAQIQTARDSAIGGPVSVAPSGTALQWPVPGGYISQYFHAGHLALDIAASYGSSVVAAEAGVVTSAGWRNNGGGIVVEIDHGNGMRTVYNHLSGVWVGPGQAVARGQGIAAVGCTGICTGSHVHFEVIVNGAIQNPLRYLN